MPYRLGVDVGGTFTDLALYDVDNDSLEFSKIPSTPDNQAVGVADGIREMVGRLGVSPGDIGFFITARPSPPTRCWSAAAPGPRLS